jgi:hypothetical protein
MPKDWKEDLTFKISKFILKGDYRSGLQIAKLAMKERPNEYFTKYQYAKLLGDWADELPLAKRLRYKKQAAKILLPITKSIAHEKPLTRFGICLNYYYQSYAFQKMYSFGKRFAKYDKSKSYYAKGLGAVLQAEVLWNKNKNRSAQAWAKKSISAWEKYDLKTEKYYFAHYSYAKALAIAGQNKDSKKALQRAATLSKRKLSDWEFQDVLSILNG